MAKATKKKITPKKTTRRVAAKKVVKKAVKRNPLKVAQKNVNVTYKKCVSAEKALERANKSHQSAVAKLEHIESRIAAKAAA